MLVITDSEFDKIADNVDKMLYKPGDRYDPWYPTAADVKKRMTCDTEEDLIFLLWLMEPGLEMTPDQKEEKKKILKEILYNEKYIRIVPDEEETDG